VRRHRCSPSAPGPARRRISAGSAARGRT
jgi:hypothetical protein